MVKRTCDARCTILEGRGLPASTSRYTLPSLGSKGGAAGGGWGAAAAARCAFGFGGPSSVCEKHCPIEEYHGRKVRVLCRFGIAQRSGTGRALFSLATCSKKRKKKEEKNLLFEGGLELAGLAVLALRSEEAQQTLKNILRVRVRVTKGAASASKGFPGERLCLTQPALSLKQHR